MGQDRREAERMRQGVPRRYFVAEVAPAAWQPNVDVYETDEAVVVVVELAGIEPDSVDISIENRTLKLRGARVPRFRSSYRQFYQLEIPQGAYERIVRLPRAVDGEASQASYSAGFLEIVLPLALPFRPTISTLTGTRENREL